ncbi:MAG: DNA replication and repair protein RecF [Proteobacteria bacterium]|nr:MAG: DNA replication and repair protein RecF [Pseudomonadota bacterium]
MQILQLSAQDFRNLMSVTLTLSPHFNVFCGPNAQGKTNLLEAAYLAICQRSFRGARVKEMVRFGCERARVVAQTRAEGLDSDVQVVLEGERRRVTIDGKALRSVAGGLSRGLAAVLFTPDDLQVPKGSPGERRRLLDRAVATVWADYPSLVRDYTKALRSRNRLLREPQPGVEALLDVYDRSLAGLGAKVMLARQRYLRSLSPRYHEAFARIVGAQLEAGLVYTSAPPLAEVLHHPQTELVELMRRYEALLGASRRRDLERRATSIGPHADDLELTIDGRSARQFASQGQTRALMLAFKIAQILDTHDKLSQFPILLLDDVSSELDAEKNAYLFEFIKEISCQVLLTTTRAELVPLVNNRFDFKVLDGTIAISQS